MSRTYTYQQRCPIARSLEIVGDRWTLLVIRDLNRGHSKFVDLMRELRGIAPNVLSDRLKLLESEGLVASILYSKHPPRAEYSLTERGEALIPVLDALTEWGTLHTERRHPAPDTADHESGARKTRPARNAPTHD